MGNGINGIGNGAQASLYPNANSVNANANANSTTKSLSAKESRQLAKQERRAARQAQRAAKKAASKTADAAQTEAKAAKKAAKAAAKNASRSRKLAMKMAMNRDTVRLSVGGTPIRSQSLQAEASQKDVFTSTSDPAQNDYSGTKSTFKFSHSPSPGVSSNAPFGVTPPTTALHAPASGVNFAPADKGSANGPVFSPPTSTAGLGNNDFTGSLNPTFDPSLNNLGQPEKVPSLGTAPKNANGQGPGQGQGLGQSQGPGQSPGPKGPGSDKGLGLGKTKNAKAAQPANKPYKFAGRGPDADQLLRYSGNLSRSFGRGPVNMNAMKLNIQGADTAPATSESGRLSIKLDDNYLKSLYDMKAVARRN